MTSAKSPRTPKSRSDVRLAADIGGTFTDIAVFDDRTGKLAFGKALSTPRRLVDGISAGVDKAGSDYAAARLFLHGSTIAINTILERKGARTALLITEGFRDIYEIGRINRPDAYNLFFQKHEPLVERALRFEVKERVLADGEIDTPLDEAEIAALGRKLGDARHRGDGDPVPQLLSHGRPRGARQGDPRAQSSRHVRVGLARTVAGISRVRALLDRRGQRLYRPDRAPLHRRDRRPHPRRRLRRLVPDRAIDRRPVRGRAGQEPLRAHAGIGAGRRRHRHAGALPHARARRMPSPSTWAAPPPRPA